MDRPKTFGIGMRQLRPCDACGGVIAPAFYHIRVRDAVIRPQNVNSLLGVAMILGGAQKPGALAIADVMAPGSDTLAEVIDEPVEIFLCLRCLAGMPALAIALERRHRKIAEEAERARQT